MWGEEEAKKKAPDFIEEVCNLYEAVQDGYVTDEQLAELLDEMAGVKITADWLKRPSSKNETRTDS
jgi:NTP pyrophosphatase (non-canonical NTP hydrolase)